MIVQRRTVLIAFIALIAAVALVLASLALTRGSSSVKSVAPRSGIYLDGPSDQPHFFVVVTRLRGGRVRGAVDFQFQNGQTSLVFTFGGFSQATSEGSATGVLTLIPERNANDTSDQLLEPPPSAVSATFGARGLELGECASYLHVSSLSRCQFTLSTNALP
jgi:hypothetical protein